MAMLSLLIPLRPAEAGDLLEYRVKAAFLFNVLKFVEWPAAAGDSPWPAAAGDSPWVIGILGHDPFGGVLEDTVRGRTVCGRRVEVRHYTRPSDVKDCNLLFIGRVDYERFGIPARLGLLTMGETPGFLKSGGILNFYIDDNRVHFEIRGDLAHAAGLRVSSRLLKLAGTP
jgi:hypothetical protein